MPGLARDVVAEGGSLEELRGCVRHLVVFAGYGPCLAATLALHKAGLLPENTPAKVGCGEGNAGAWQTVAGTWKQSTCDAQPARRCRRWAATLVVRRAARRGLAHFPPWLACRLAAHQATPLSLCTQM